MSEDNKALVRKMLAGADANDIGVLDEVLADGYVDHNPPPFQGPGTGLPGARDGFEIATKIFSDWHHDVLAQYTDGDYVITRVVGRGTHTGEMLGIPPSNNEVSMEGIAIHRIENGKIAEHWGQVDSTGLLMQMGAFPPPE
jgi:predicted ester cyclase